MDKARNGTTGHGSPTVMRFGYVKFPHPASNRPLPGQPHRWDHPGAWRPLPGSAGGWAGGGGRAVVGAGPVSWPGLVVAIPGHPVVAGMTAPAEAGFGTAALRR